MALNFKLARSVKPDELASTCATKSRRCFTRYPRPSFTGFTEGYDLEHRYVTVLAFRVAVVWGHAVGQRVDRHPSQSPLGARDDNHAKVAAGRLAAPVRWLASDPHARSKRQH